MKVLVNGCSLGKRKADAYLGMERLHKSMTAYVKSISKQGGIEDKEKVIPVGHLGTTMISHGQDFDKDSSFGNCLTG